MAFYFTKYWNTSLSAASLRTNPSIALPLRSLEKSCARAVSSGCYNECVSFIAAKVRLYAGRITPSILTCAQLKYCKILSSDIKLTANSHKRKDLCGEAEPRGDFREETIARELTKSLC
ncbi:hypothetical protein TNCV_517251 [Trichonephila clavipes]|nr:hypothetical protein TNCV_517251 [Trichonephila clavipes]